MANSDMSLGKIQYKEPEKNTWSDSSTDFCNYIFCDCLT